MSISTQINRLVSAKEKIKTKLISLGLIDSEANIDTCANAIENINNIGKIDLIMDAEQAATYEIPSGYTSGGTVSVVIVTHYYYNDLRLPKLPSDSIQTHPYCWIRNNGQTGYYDLIMSTTTFYYDSGNTRLKHRGSDADIWYRIPKSTADSATSWGSPQNHSYVGWTVDSNRTAFWANHDVTQSESSTTIYLKGTEPEPEINGQELLTMIEEIL